MKINNVMCLVSSREEKVNKNTNLPYWSIGIVTLDGDGTALNISVKEKEIAEKLKPMFKYNLNLSLSNSQYGMRVELAALNPIVKELGSIIEGIPQGK